MNHTMAFMAGGFGWGEIIVVLLVLVLLFGAKRVPELARALGRSLSEFKKGREQGGAESDAADGNGSAEPSGTSRDASDDETKQQP